MTENLDADQRAYLAAVVRADIRKRERSAANFRAFPGQDPAEAAAALDRARGRLKWKRGILAVLEGLSGQDGTGAKTECAVDSNGQPGEDGDREPR